MMRFARFARSRGIAETRAFSALQTSVKEKITPERTRLVELRKKHANTKIGDITVGSVIGGMRGMTGMLFETSLLDANEGIRFRGKTVEECKRILPKFKPGQSEMPLPESMLWLLMTGDVPTQAQVKDLQSDLNSRIKISETVLKALYALPKDLHPMAAFSNAVLMEQRYSKVSKNYHDARKLDLWELYLDDSLDLVANIPIICATIFNRVDRGLSYEENLAALNARSDDMDWTGNFCNSIGYTDEAFHELLRLYFTIHSCHEGGNVSAHASHVVGSALSDPYYAFAAGMCGLAGPLHGLANQECLRFILELQAWLEKEGLTADEKTVKVFCESTLANGQVIPGFGHAVLRKTDPRYTIQREFALENLPDDKTFKICNLLYKVVPDILQATGKVQNPWPNVDAVSGCLLQHYKFTNQNYYTMLFGMGRSLGVLSALTWSRAFVLPIERPKSVTIEALSDLADKSAREEKHM